MYQAATAPQSIGGVLDDGFRLYRAALSKVIVLTFAAVLVGQLPSAMLQTTPGTVPTLSAGVLISFLVVMVVSSTCYAAAICRMNAVVEQRDVTLGQALSTGVGRLLPLIGYSLLYGIIFAVGMVLLVVPGIIFGLTLVFGAYAVIIDGEGPVESLATSHRLVWGHWWRTALIMTVVMFILIAVYVVVGFVSGVAAAVIGSGDFQGAMRMMQFVVMPLVAAVVSPLMYALMLATYYDLKLRRSGADLEQRLGAPARA